MDFEDRLESIEYWIGEFDAGNCGYKDFAENMFIDVPVILSELAHARERIGRLEKQRQWLAECCSLKDGIINEHDPMYKHYSDQNYIEWAEGAVEEASDHA